jgi:hypothetical protein
MGERGYKKSRKSQDWPEGLELGQERLKMVRKPKDRQEGLGDRKAA